VPNPQTGDHQVIAKETSRQLGLGTNIPDAANLPTMDADGKIPKDLGKNYGKMILDADGFAQVGACALGPRRARFEAACLVPASAPFVFPPNSNPSRPPTHPPPAHPPT
jgi:hypothetical protein